MFRNTNLLCARSGATSERQSWRRRTGRRDFMKISFAHVVPELG